MATEKTPWRKNLDSRYISGENLKYEMAGLKPEMVVVVESFEDVETYDQKNQTDAVKSGLFLVDFKTGKKLSKPAILNVRAAKFFEKEFNSIFIDDWLKKPVVIYAKPDKRFNWVVDFKKYYPPQISDVNALGVLSVAENLQQLGEFWATLTAEEKKLPTVMKLKDELKKKFTTGEIA